MVDRTLMTLSELLSSGIPFLVDSGLGYVTSFGKWEFGNFDAIGDLISTCTLGVALLGQYFLKPRH